MANPSEQDRQAHHSNDVLAHWFLCRHSKQKPRQEAGLSWSCCHTGLADLSGGQQTHHPNAEPQSWFLDRRKSPAEAGLSQPHVGRNAATHTETG